MATQSIKVWDPIVRIGHWTLVIAFFTAYFTEDDFMTQHVWAGYIVGGVVLFRLLWGFISTSQHARFRDFIYKPSQIVGYLKGLVAGKAQHYKGHNPAGGAMVIALLLSLVGTVYSGLALYAVEDNAGPFANIYGANTMTLPTLHIIQPAEASNMKSTEKHGEKQYTEHSADRDSHEFWEGLHEFFTNFTLLLVALHIAGVLLSSLVDKENLIKAMITGKKDQ